MTELNDRGHTLLAGKIVCNFGQSIIDCVVRRISDHGATVEVESPFGIPQHFHLLIAGGDPPRPCKLVWQSGKELGLEFEHPAAAANEVAIEPEHHPERHSHSALTGQMLALRLALDEIQNGVLLLGGDLRAQFINRAFRKMWNVSDALADSKPAFVALLYHCRENNAYQTDPADIDAFIGQRLRLVRAGDTTPLDLRRSNGEVIRLQCTVLPNGGRLLTYTVVTDIVRHADELEVLRSALDNIQDGVLLLDADLKAQFLNRQMREYWGVTEEQAAGHPAYSRLITRAQDIGDDNAAPGKLCGFFTEKDAAAHIADTSARDVRIPDGRHIRVHCLHMPNGGRMFTYCDVTDLIRNAKQLEKLATIDSMTNLYNRRHFLALAETEWSRCRRHQRPLSMLMIDIDHFKTVNDRYGHAVGDQAIVATASACRESTRGEDFAGRLGGEEFAILLPETDQAQAMILAERIRERVANQALTAHKDCFNVTISIGVAAAADSMSGLDSLLGAADQALYQAKAEGRNRTVQWLPLLAAE